MRFEVNPQDKRLRIMQAAVRVFAQKGFHRAKMEEIARTADVGKGTVYEYFPSKERLFIEMIKIGKKYYQDRLMAQIKGVEGFSEKLKEVAYLHMIFFHEHRDMTQVMMQEYLQLGAEVHEEFAQFHEQEIRVIREIIAQGTDEGSFRPQETERTSLFFYGAVHAVSCRSISALGKNDLEKLAEEVTDLFLRGIALKS
ncbi:TetR/AcrR family transcriptional regulator [Dehalobacterium formicoaceticum]|uniref:TetR/AcrR family transcriptional regulator n=1 Tax=Dehalobacterium formicoaceticum TaxID=51515 RepID=UPI000B7CD138|nr:TetR/AcrR family transcriptional regulator [Dehalobacterium formicoaceticum]